jgi:hypothetical protein
MTLHTAGGTGLAPSEAFTQIRLMAQGAKNGAQGYLSTLQGGSVNTLWVFNLLDATSGFIAAVNTWKVVTGLDTYATAQGYNGTLTSDVTACVAAAKACIDWVVANFPTSVGYIQGFTLNADGSRTPRTFTSVETAGLQSALTAFIATIS